MMYLRFVLVLAISPAFVSCAIFSADSRSAHLILSLNELHENREKLDGEEVWLDGYLSFEDGAITGDYYDIHTAETYEDSSGKLVTRCSGSQQTNVLFHKVDFFHRFFDLNRRRVILKGTFHNSQREVYYTDLSFTYNGWLTNVKIIKVYDEYCERIRWPLMHY